MKLTNEFEPIREWAKEKGIYKKGDPKTQYIKLLEEVGELAQSILKNDEEEFMDAIGDCVVVLTNLAALKGFNIEDCINGSYGVIAKRKGKMINGTFVKDGESIDAVEFISNTLKEELDKSIQNENSEENS